MKDKLQIVILVLLALVIVGMGFLYAGQRQIMNQLSSLDWEIQSSVSSAMNSAAYQLEQTVTNSKFLVVGLRDEFPKSIMQDEEITGEVYFELTENKDMKNVYVVFNSVDDKDSLKFKAEYLDSLKYKADIKLERACDYNYYVIAETNDGDDVMLSSKTRCYLDQRIRKLVYYSPEGVSCSSNKITATGTLQIHSTAEIEKIELQILTFSLEDLEDMDYKSGTVVDSVDITESLVPTTYSEDVHFLLYDREEYDLYSFDVTKRAEGDVNYLQNEVVEVAVVVTFSDGTVETMFY